MDKNPAAVTLGSLGGKSKSDKKVKAARANGKSGGRPSTSTRFWKQVEKTDKCWNWQGEISHNGYGRFRVVSTRILTKRMPAHHFSFKESGKVIPDGLVIDHLCRNRACVNPSHMEAVTIKENVNRGSLREYMQKHNEHITHCPKGHPYDEQNTYKRPSRESGRECRACNKERSVEWRARHKN